MKFFDCDDFNNARYINMESLKEENSNSLFLIIERCKVSDESEDIFIGDKTIKECRSIECDDSLPRLCIEFETYVAYSIRSESYTGIDKYEEYEEYEGNWLRIYSKSRFLNYVKESTCASDIYPGPFKHYGIICLNHIIDVVSTDEPILSEID